MQKFISIFFALAIILCATDVDAKTTKKSTRKRKSSTSSSLGIAKGAVNNYDDYLKTQTFTIKKGDAGKIEVEYPIGGDPRLVKSVRTHIKDCINRYYKGSLESPYGLLRSALKWVGREDRFYSDIHVTYSTPKLITFETTGYEQSGGATHGEYYNTSVTFIVATGQEFDKSMLPDFDEMQDYILDALARDRKTTVDKIIDSFYNPDSLQDYGVVYITEDGINVFYQPEEIAPYMSGSFYGVIPFEEVYDLLPEKTQKLLE